MQLIRPHVEVGPSSNERKERDTGAPIKLDAEAQAHIEKHRYAPLCLQSFFRAEVSVLMLSVFLYTQSTSLLINF